jgi:UMF1 family MFS transporter
VHTFENDITYTNFTQAFFFLAVLVGLPFPIMMLVDVERGRAEGVALSKELQRLAHEEEEREDRDRAYDDLVYETEPELVY